MFYQPLRNSQSHIRDADKHGIIADEALLIVTISLTRRRLISVRQNVKVDQSTLQLLIFVITCTMEFHPTSQIAIMSTTSSER